MNKNKLKHIDIIFFFFFYKVKNKKYDFVVFAFNHSIQIFFYLQKVSFIFLNVKCDMTKMKKKMKTFVV